MEETMEQAVISWQAEQNTTWGEFGMMLQDAQKSTVLRRRYVITLSRKSLLRR